MPVIETEIIPEPGIIFQSYNLCLELISIPLATHMIILNDRFLRAQIRASLILSTKVVE